MSVVNLMLFYVLLLTEIHLSVLNVLKPLFLNIIIIKYVSTFWTVQFLHVISMLYVILVVRKKSFGISGLSYIII